MDEDLTLAPESSAEQASATPAAASEEGEKVINDDQPMHDAEDDPDSSDSDSDGSDSEDEAQQNLQLRTLETELSANPSNYDAHVQYIKLLRKLGDIEKLRKAREAMSELFPLSPTMWQEWTKDEASLNTGPEAFSAIEKLYERGVFDYLSVSLWADYINFIQEFDPSVRQCLPDGISKARDLFESALTAVGLHVAQGGKIWEAYREYEQALLLTIDEGDAQGKEKRIQRIRSLFHRQLSVPLADMSSTLAAYKVWEMEQGNLQDVESSDLAGIYPNVASAYQKAKEMYNARVQFEDQVSCQDISDSDRLQHYMNYLKFEQSSGTPARVQVLYERAITDFPLSSDLWVDYTRYLDKTLKVGNIIHSVYSRATKNCPWVGRLWSQYLLSLERGHASEEEIAAVFEKSLQCTFSTLDEYLDLFLTRVDGLRRRMATASEDDLLDYKIIREIFQRASDYLSPHLKNTEGLLHLHAYWACLEAKLGKDITAARGVWESFLKTCGSMLEAWKGYIEMEIALGHVNEARSIYKRCYSKRFPWTGSEDICYSWLRFEREFGTLEDFDHASQKVTPRLEELQSFRIQQESKTTEEKENNLKRNARDKRKLGSDMNDEQAPAKRQKDAARNLKKVAEEKKDQLQNFSSAEKVSEVNEKVNKSDNVTQQLSSSEKTRAFSDQCTAFISNLNPKANDKDITKFFSDVGGVVAIRILRDKFTGKSRGLAYVDFSDDEHLAAAIAKNKQQLLGKKLSIARSNPKQGRNQSSGQQSLKESSTYQFDQAASISKESDDSSKKAVKDAKSASTIRHGGDNFQLKGKNTFAAPRSVKPIGWTASKPKSDDGDETPKSNDEFRKMFIRKD